MHLLVPAVNAGKLSPPSDRKLFVDDPVGRRPSSIGDAVELHRGRSTFEPAGALAL